MSGGQAELHGSTGGLRKLVFWEFARASWQYDLVVALILVFIFAMPREWFGDQPRAANIVLLSSNNGHQQVYFSPNLFAGVPETSRSARASELIHQKTGKHPKVNRVEAIRDEAEHEIKGFIAYTTP